MIFENYCVINDNKFYKHYKDDCYISSNGEVISTKFNKVHKINPSITHDGYLRFDISRKHIKLHRAVYETWIGNIPDELQINHKNDNKLDNSIDNLYAGTQKENIADCIKNSHRVGHIKPMKVLELSSNKVLEFSKVKDFIKYSGHPVSNGSMSKVINSNWFNNEYELL